MSAIASTVNRRKHGPLRDAGLQVANAQPVTATPAFALGATAVVTMFGAGIAVGWAAA